MYGLRIVTAPTAEPLTLAEARAHRRLDEVTDDALLAAMIIAVREAVEHETQRSVIAKTYELSLDAFPSGATIYLPMPPVVPDASSLTITSVKYTDSAGVEQTVDPADYTLDAYSWSPRLEPVSGWPSPKDTMNAVRVRYQSGPAFGSVPQGVKQWMLLHIGELYEHRESAMVGSGLTVAPLKFVDHLLDPYRSFL